jgi:hypothetical protein
VYCPTVTSILHNLGLDKYASQFADADIDYDTFLTLNEDHLQELDLTLGVRIKIMNEVSHLKEQEECARGKKNAYITNIWI